MVDNQEINSQSKMLKFDQVIMLQEMDSYDLFDRIIYVVDPELEVERIIIKAHAVLLYYEILQQEKREFFEVLFGAFIEAYTGRYQQQIYTRKFLIALFRALALYGCNIYIIPVLSKREIQVLIVGSLTPTSPAIFA